MFTGIVEELGQVQRVVQATDAIEVTIRGDVVTADAQLGDSIAVNGVCLTVASVNGAEFTADVMAETLNRSTLDSLIVGDRVNLERPVTLTTRLGGHMVQGHVDATSEVLERTTSERWDVVRFSLPGPLSRYVVEKGSITLDGVSLTVAELGDTWFRVSLVPTTLSQTTLGARRPGDAVNVEIDVIAKYVERLLSGGAA
jgi:riboflavin synthase